MADATVASEVQVFAGWPAFARIPFTVWAGGVACAVLVGSGIALTVSSVAPMPTVSPPAPLAHRADRLPLVAGQQAAAPRAARQVGVALDVAKVWTEERDLIAAAVNSEIHRDLARAWLPAGGLSILLAGGFSSTALAPQAASEDAAGTPSSATMRVAGADESVPLPRPSPVARFKNVAGPAISLSPTTQQMPQVAAVPKAPTHGFFDFFRNLFSRHSDEAVKTILAANPQTAIYDIKAHVVYLPNGDKLEAHSGLGDALDDPATINQKDRGVTPPNVYAISLRSQLFHGVRALRLTPIGNGNMYGRDGILAHTYMLGKNGQSNGCVSFKDYQKFLQAFEDGEVKRLIVVTSVDSVPARVASSQPGSV